MVRKRLELEAACCMRTSCTTSTSCHRASHLAMASRVGAGGSGISGCSYRAVGRSQQHLLLAFIFYCANNFTRLRRYRKHGELPGSPFIRGNKPPDRWLQRQKIMYSPEEAPRDLLRRLLKYVKLLLKTSFPLNIVGNLSSVSTSRVPSEAWQIAWKSLYKREKTSTTGGFKDVQDTMNK
ncbi:hypothetical protein NDU88_001585 [Pleurodeles waltl]|uniref:Uncharacterized protein n=1 Tax=Pleurodeles waltl TaxID=8319 RepID=A0AAV7S958_PLEWA|nr:hypothetical protein NDU88_001585 [Pleurodeles waltl]